jgi:membrane-bound lytic murein transglycosylase B
MIKRVNRILKLVLLLFLILALFKFFSFEKIFAQEGEECGTREECEAILRQYEEEIAKYEADVTKTQKEKDTLNNKITILKNQIKKLDLQISQSNLMIKDLTIQLEDTEGSIEKNSLKIEKEKENLSNILRSIYEEDQKTLFEILLSENELSGFFDNLMALENLNYRNKDLLKEIKNLKAYLEDQKESLDQEKTDLGKLLEMQQLQKQENESVKKQQESLLAKTKGKESEYQKLLKSTQQKAAEIRARIFELIGIPQAPTFGEAYELAKYVEGATGIRSALLLAVLTQESNIGKNVGQCFLVSLTTGEGVRIQSGKAAARTMKPGQNISAFLQITQELGRDPLNTPVSCPMSYGWGGAMGPAQFIPSTWMIYRDRVKTITGTADPWSIKDAFVAAALYLKDKGADSKNYNDEWKAAIAYFAGNVNLKYRFYGDSVMATATQYEKDIKEIENLAKASESLTSLEVTP